MTAERTGPNCAEAALLDGRAAAARSQAARIREEAAAITTAGAEQRDAIAAQVRQRVRELGELANGADRLATADEDRARYHRRAGALREQLAATPGDEEARAELDRVLDLLDPTRPEARQAAFRATQAADEAREDAEDAEARPRIFGRAADD